MKAEIIKTVSFFYARKIRESSFPSFFSSPSHSCFTSSFSPPPLFPLLREIRWPAAAAGEFRRIILRRRRVVVRPAATHDDEDGNCEFLGQRSFKASWPKPRVLNEV
jgi:hypothetical protein